MTPSPPNSLLIAGLGNVLLGDDGVGVHAVRKLQRCPPAGVTVVEIGTAVLHGLSFVESAQRVLLIDAMQGGRPPGTIYLMEMAAEATGMRPTQPPLTPARSHGGGEGDTLGSSAHAFSTVSASAPSPLNGETPTPTPSPLNGERAGVRGETTRRPNWGPMHSLHSLGLLEAMRVLLPHRPLPPVTVIGVEPAALDYGLSLSPAVAAALPRVVALARRTVLRWRTEPAEAASATAIGARSR